ncbi:RE2 [Symbiodinium sp. CCMP2592]|nr:RE2 [Symbiodinium sp. CCMP2592]
MAGDDQDDQPTSMYQSTSWQAPPGAQASGAAAPDSAELPRPFDKAMHPPSAGGAPPDPWADYLSSNQSRAWDHPSWQWQGNSWNGWHSWDDAKMQQNEPRGGYAWGRNWSWDATWASGSTGSGGDIYPDGEEEKHGDDGRATTTTSRRSAMLAASTSTAPAATTRSAMDSERGEERGEDHGRGPSERMLVPSFSGDVGAGEGSDLGSTARSYLRQVAAWQKMTRISANRQGLVLYQHLSGKAWIEAERLDIDKLSGPSGSAYFVEWIRERYLDVQVTQVGRSLSEFFRKLRKKPGQNIRDYVGEFDRAQARLEECGCTLPDIALAWMFVDRLGLDEPSELNLLASVGNVYDLRRLQQAATIHDRALRKPWEGTTSTTRPWQRRQGQSVHYTGNHDLDDDFHGEDCGTENAPGDEPLTEGMAEELFTTYMSHETAKQKYRDSQRGRGTDPQAMKEIAAAKLQQLKARSFCAGCKRRGHWHKDDACPLNQGKGLKDAAEHGGSGGAGPNTKASYMCNVVYVAWNIEEDICTGEFDAITDTACSKSVAGNGWLDEYIGRLERIGERPRLLPNDDNFKFGASRVFHSDRACIVTFKLGQAVVEVKVAIVTGDLPLLLSRPVLAKLGMIMDVALNRADFKAVQLNQAPADFWSDGEIMFLYYRYYYLSVFVYVDHYQGVSCKTGQNMDPVFDVWSADDHDMATSPAATKQPCVSQMNKAALLSELQQRNMTVHPKWTVPELRSILSEERAKEKAGNVPKGLSSMTLDDLKKTAANLNIVLPDNTNRGLIMRMIRDSTEDKSEHIMTFGRYKGYLYEEVPMGYRKWAQEEIRRNTNASDDLRMFAMWAEQDENKMTHAQAKSYYADPETTAVVPYNPEEESNWEVVTEGTESSSSATRKSATGLPMKGGYAATMDLDADQADAQALEEIRALEMSETEGDYRDCIECVDGQREKDYYDTLEINEVMCEAFVTDETAEEMNTAGLPRPNHDLAVELASYAAAANNDFTYQTLFRIATLLPEDARVNLRQSAEGSAGRRGLVGGVWTHGKMAGITNNVVVFPWFVKYLSGWASHHGVASWTSFMLTENVSHGVHSDNHNLPGYPNITTSFGEFNGGELWMEVKEAERTPDETYVWRQGSDGKERPGRLTSTQRRIVSFDPKIRHATQPWSGTRWCLTFFASRGIAALDRNGRELLRRLGMVLPDLRKRPPLLDDRPPAGRPAKRSARKLIHRTSKRLGALATWSIMAASSFLEAHLPTPGGPDGVALCEVGGTTRTEEAVDADYLATEPLDQAYILREGGRTRGLELIRTLRPSTLWIHGDAVDLCEDAVSDYIQEQLDASRRVVVDAAPDGNFWRTGFGVRLLQDPTATLYEEAGLKTVEFNSTRADWNEATESIYPGTINVYMAQTSGESPPPAEKVVGVDVFSVVDSTGRRVEMLSVFDHGTSFHVVGELREHSTEAMEQTFCEVWTRTFGAPGTIALDLESGLQAGLARYSSWHGCHLRSIAGQAHWQLGATERHGGLWKAIWKRVCDDLSLREEDVPMGIAAVNDAKNQLRRISGYSPAQAVFGRDPYIPGDLLDEKDGEQQEHLINHDLQGASDSSGDAKLRRALLQRSRVAGEELHPGDLVFFLRKPKNTKDWSWKGPGTVVGHEHQNLWISFGGRCHLVAPEHTRRATNEETGNAFILKTTKDDLQRLAEFDPDDEEMYESPERPGDDYVPDEMLDILDETSVFDDEIELPGEDEVELPGEDEDTTMRSVREDPPQLPSRGPPKRMRQKGPEHVNMLKRATTARGREKQLERELPWHCIPPEKHADFRRAEDKQWSEHLEHGAMKPVDVETSKKILAEKPERVLPSRFAYRDKHWAKRKTNPDLDWKCKARLVIGGHVDPDITSGLTTSAPTVSRQGVLLLCQILASRRQRGWSASAGDITCAFLNGNELKRELYIRQPRGGLGDLHPDQIVQLTKGVFGLVDSPNAWYEKLQGTILALDISLSDGRRGYFDQCPLDPCIFQFKVKDLDGNSGAPEAYVAVHVDDLLMVGDRELNRQLKDALSKAFPVDDWEDDSFEYMGSTFTIDENGVTITQESYADTRLFEVEIEPAASDEYPASAEQRADNRSLIGALSWIAGQTRPDLQTGVSMAQQLQREPTIGDVRFTNSLSRKAKQYRTCGVHLTPVDLENCVLLTYHDAAWANAPQDPDDPYYQLTPEEDICGTMREGPFASKDRKPKRGNSRIASQLGGIYLLADSKILDGDSCNTSLLDWRSWACDRVCRSTFAAETMACASGIENAQYIQSFMATLLAGVLVRPKNSPIKTRFMSDCRSLRFTQSSF